MKSPSYELLLKENPL